VNPVGNPFLSVPAKIDLEIFALIGESLVTTLELDEELLTELSLEIVEEVAEGLSEL
jgi:hypothetical protein